MRHDDSMAPLVSLAMKLNAEKREFTRIPVQAKAILLVDDQIIEGEVENLSLKGACVRTDTVVEIDRPVIITIFATLTSQTLSEMKAKVVSVTGDRLGLQFDTSQ